MTFTFQVAKADKGDFATGSVAWDVLHCVAKHQNSLPHTIDLSECVMVRPYGMACIVAMGAKSSQKIVLRPPKDDQCAAHLSRHQLTEWFRCDSHHAIPSRPTNVVTRQLTDRPGQFSDETIQVLTSELDLSVNTANILATHLDEVIVNALTHSESPIGCIVAGQAFPRNKHVEIAVLDLGQTIRGHLARNPAHFGLRTDQDAILRATEEGVTGTVGRNRWNEQNSGIGLFELRNYCEAGHGELSILSGDHCLTFGPKGTPTTHRFRGFFAGCLVNVRFFAR